MITDRNRIHIDQMKDSFLHLQDNRQVILVFCYNQLGTLRKVKKGDETNKISSNDTNRFCT